MATVDISRPACTVNEFRTTSGYERQTKPARSVGQMIASKLACSADGLKSSVLGFFPFIGVMSSYNWRNWLMGDVIAGVSVGVIHIPQGMGFALLASVPAVYGLYSSFFPVILYFIFGTSRHISVGTMAVISLLISVVVDREMIRMGLDGPDVNQTDSSSPAFGVDVDATKVGVACAVSLLAGVIQFAMGVCRLGVIASFMSQSFVGGFMTGAGFHITTSQLSNLFGVTLRPITGAGKIPLVVFELLKNATSINIADVIISVITVSILLGIKKGINERFRHRMKAPIPAELIAVAVAIFASYMGDLRGRFGVRILGHIPTGIPAPELPLMDNATTYLGDALVIAIVSFAISISMAKIFQRKHRYEIDANQELYAYGICNGVSAFFHCIAGCQAPPRSLVHDAVGGRTQLAGLVSSALVLLVCTVAAPLFQPLPKSVLACVIVVALLPLFDVFGELRKLWRVSRSDLVVWLVTWATVTFVDVTTGLIVGMAASLLTVVAQSRMARGEVLAVAGGVYAPQRDYSGLKPVIGVHVFGFPAPLYFANIDNFKQQLFAGTVDPRVGRTPTAVRPDSVVSDDAAVTIDAALGKEFEMGTVGAKEPVVIVDCSAMCHIDVMGLNLLRQLRADYAAVGVTFALCCCSEPLLRKLQAADILKADDSQPAQDVMQVFPTIEDAVMALTSRP